MISKVRPNDQVFYFLLAYSLNLLPNGLSYKTVKLRAQSEIGSN